MKSFLPILLFLPVWAQDPPNPPVKPEVTPEAEQAIQRALQYLSRQQNRDGSFSSGVPVATTSMACLAFMANGSTPSRGAYAGNIVRGIEFLLKRVSRDGFITESGGFGASGMHGHGFATLFFAESLGMIEDPSLYERVHAALKRAVTLIERTQNRFGGWNHSPNPTSTDDGSGAVAIMQIMALRAARNAGIHTRQDVIQRSKKYLLEMTTEDGWYQYNYNNRGSHRSSGLTGPGMYMLGALDLYHSPKYERGIRNIMNSAPFLKGGRGDPGWGSWYHYTLFYCSLAIFQHGSKEWAIWYPKMRDELTRRQSKDGRWPDDAYGGLFSAFAALALQLPYRYLPFFQEGGRGREGR